MHINDQAYPISLQPSSDSSQWATLYAEFADEDRIMTEVDIAEYAELLIGEDDA